MVTFSVGFREDETNELADARRVAETFGCEHHEVELSVTEDALEPRRARLASRRARRRPLRPRLRRALAACGRARHRRARRPGGRRALRRLHEASRGRTQSARSTEFPQAARTGSPPSRGRARGCAARFEALAAPDPSRRLLEMSGRLHDAAPIRALSRPARGRPGGQRARRRRGGARRASTAIRSP